MTALPEVPRWDCVTVYPPNCGPMGDMEERPAIGDWVRYTDHLSAMQQQRDTALREALAAVEEWTDRSIYPRSAYASLFAVIQRLIDGGDTR